MGEPDAVRRNRELQRRFYGEPLGDRLRRLLAGYDVSQAVLAETLGLSSSMLSQLMSGRRGKIGTPAVLGRVVLLERGLAAPGTPAATDPAARDRLLAEVRDAEPRVDVAGSAGSGSPGGGAYEVLRTAAPPAELARAAETLDRGFPSLATVLRAAAEAG